MSLYVTNLPSKALLPNLLLSVRNLSTSRKSQAALLMAFIQRFPTSLGGVSSVVSLFFLFSFRFSVSGWGTLSRRLGIGIVGFFLCLV